MISGRFSKAWFRCPKGVAFGRLHAVRLVCLEKRSQALLEATWRGISRFPVRQRCIAPLTAATVVGCFVKAPLDTGTMP